MQSANKPKPKRDISRLVCDCSRPAVRIKNGEPVCERCDKLERETLAKSNLQGVVLTHT